MRACFNLPRHIRDMCFTPEAIRRLASLVELTNTGDAEEISKADLLQAAANCEILITGWGSLPIDQELLEAAPELKVALHSAGSIRSMETSEMWQRGVRVTSAAHINGIPVAEFLLGQILMALKGVFTLQHEFKREGRAAWKPHNELPGYYRSTVGIIGMGNVGKHLLKLLEAFSFRTLVHSFYPFEEQACGARVELVEIDQIMAESDAVVVAAPNIPEYAKMFDARRFALMKTNAWFLNAARGALVDEQALLHELQSGRINACLDVSDPEPPAEGSPFYTLPNCILTPHIAGSIGRECFRMGDQVVRELEHYLRGEPFENEITEELSKLIG